MFIYRCDGTKEGILCCLYDSFTAKRVPDAVYSGRFQPAFDQEVIDIKTDEKIAARVRSGIVKCGGISLLSELFLPLRSCESLRETVVFFVAYRCLKERRNVITDYTDANVLLHRDLASKIKTEVHRMRGFLRFAECTGGLYAHFSPDNDIVDLVAPHFAKRFSGERFIIHDTKRNLICAYDGKSLQTIKNDGPVSVFLTEDERIFDNLWKTYFKSVNIESRKNLKQQDNYLPRRYRKNMNEFL